MPSREHIISEIQRTAEANGGTPLGKSRFLSETGIRESDWLGRFWAKWSEALAEAGYDNNTMTSRLEDDAVLEALAGEVRRLGRIPTSAELRLARRDNPAFPSHNVFSRFGPKTALIARLADFCRSDAEYADVAAFIPEPPMGAEDQPLDPASDEPGMGFVYLLRSGRFYKIGLTLDMDGRLQRLKIQLPERVTEVHRIVTDDPRGIERYWHERFADRRKNGEWFELSAADVTAFRRRKFM